MLITKKESKQLRYFARANYKADVKGTTSEDGSKVKHRDFPVFGLSYDEKKADKGMVELTNIQVLYKPFTGTTFAELMEALNEVLGSDDVGEKVEAVEQHYEPCLLYGPDCTQEPLPPGPPIVQPIAKPQEEPEHLFGPMSHRGVVGDALQFFKDVKWVDRPKATEEPEKKTIVVTGAVVPETHDSGRDYSGLSEEAIAEAHKSVVGEDIGTMKPSVEVAMEEALEDIAKQEPPPLEEPQELPVVEKVEEAKKTAEETGEPVVTAVQKPKKTRAELYDLQIKCATMKLATSYKEPPDTDIGWLMKKYPDAVEKLNALYAADGIKTYTITEEAIKKAYPDEYAVLCP
jgi:hypothetical protein